MIEATCGACGTVARIAEADVPAGAKFVTCASCKSRVPLPGQAAAKPPVPTGKVPAIPPAIPKTPTPSTKPTIDLADLPAPKRSSPLAGIDAPKVPAPPRSPLAGAELPAPKGATGKPPAPSALDLDDLMPSESPRAKSDAGLADLPAPKPRASALGDAPPSKPAASNALADLPAPKAKPSALADLPAPKKSSPALADLPAPKAKSAADDLDLPMPKTATAPKAGGAPDLDLPGPKMTATSTSDFDLDLPMPKGGMPTLDDDVLLAPKSGSTGLPAPKGGMPSLDDDLDLPMPSGGFADLPAPKEGGAGELPAPKGFFDDLPQPAAKGGGKAGIDLPAPKGFFDDLPQPAIAKPGASDLPAPKGFFDDLPQPTKPAAGAKSGGGGFFDDLPQPKSSGPALDPGPSGGANAGGFGDLDLGLPGDRPLELDAGPSAMPSTGSSGGGNDLDVGLPLGPGDFTELDLSEPTSSSGRKAAVAATPPDEPPSPIKIKKAAPGSKPAAPIPITVKKDGPVDLKLDLADDPHEGKPGAAPAAAGGKAAPKRKGPTPEEAAELAAKKKKRSRIALAALLGLALVGGGGFYAYQKHAAKVAHQEAVASSLTRARKALSDGNPNHWEKASRAAGEVLEKEPNHVAALGIGAEAAIAGALDNGINYETRIKQGRKLVQQGIGVGKASPEIERAQALMAIAAGQADRAIPTLQKLIGAAPKDGWLQLYMGWAQLAKGDAAAALAAFEQAVALDAGTKLTALYGHGQARLLKADLEGARTDFATVLETSKDHIGAQVGLASTLPPQQSAQREADLLAILNRPDLDKADPRAVVKAWTLVGHVARTSGRLDIARERYRKALAITALDLDALNGLAAVELRDGKIQVARDLLQKALTQNPEHAEAQLLDAYADILEGKLPDGDAKLTKLAARQPPLPPLQMARLHVVKGRMLEAQGKDDAAVDEYTAGAKLAGELDLSPTMSAVIKLTELAKKTTDEAAAAAYRTRANEMLSALAERAREDAELSMTLGVAYLEAGDATKAEDMLRRAVTMRDKDPESRLQLAKALTVLGRVPDAIAQLKDALALDPKRGDIALELARTYQNAGMHTEAVAAYEKLLAGEDVETVVRVNAGRYFASRGAFDKAAAQAEPVLKIEPENAGGLYLKGEGLILAKNWDEARRILTRATDLDNTDAQALDALGRAFEGALDATGDLKFIEGARHAYERATKADPKLFHAHLGLGRMLVKAGHYQEAIDALAVASKLDASNSQVLYTMGLAVYGTRSNEKNKPIAAGWFENALRSQPELPLAEKADAQYKLGDLYYDINRPAQSAAAWEAATKLADDLEKATGKSPPWLTETWYRLGQVYEGQNNKPAQARAWKRFIARNPPDSDAKKAANYALATTLKSY